VTILKARQRIASQPRETMDLPTIIEKLDNEGEKP
jgi:hypothetical protein